MSKSMFAMATSQHTLIGRGGRMRKRGGQVVSFAPNMVDLCGSVSRVAMGGILLLAGALVSAPEAKAGTFTLVDGVYVLSGEADYLTDERLTVNELGEVAITTTPNSGLSVPSDVAIKATGSSVEFIDTNSAFISGTNTALDLQANSGHVTIESNGKLQGDFGTAVKVTLGQDATVSIQSTGEIVSAGNGRGIGVSGLVTYDNDLGTIYQTIGAVDIDARAIGTMGDAITIEGPTAGPIDISSTGYIRSVDGAGITISGAYDYTNYQFHAVNSDVNIDVASIHSFYDAIEVSIEEGSLTVAADILNSAYGDGIDADIAQGDLTINVGSIEVYRDGIDLYLRDGNANITADSVKSDYGYGIDVSIDQGDLTINVGSVDAFREGIYAYLRDGNANITANSVKSHDRDGIDAYIAQGDLTINVGSIDADEDGIDFDVVSGNATISVNAIESRDSGIYGNLANGELGITAGSIVTEDNGIDLGLSYATADIRVASIVADYDGVRIRSDNTDTVVTVGSIQAASSAVDVYNDADGNISITAQTLNSGWVGVTARTGYGDVDIDVRNVNAGYDGIRATTYAGDISITSTGRIGNFEVVQKLDDDGLPLFDNNGVPIIETVMTATQNSGVYARTTGDGGDINIAVNEVASDGQGILATLTGFEPSNLTIEANDIEAGYSGIFAYSGNDGNISISAKNVDAGYYGIAVRSNGAGQVSITTTGTVQGEYGAIRVNGGYSDVAITNSGVLKNAIRAGDIAIDVYGRSITITNNGAIEGRIITNGGNADFVNNGKWVMADGSSDFIGADDRLINSRTGIIVAAADKDMREFSRISGVDRFINNGVVSLADGGARDELYIEGGMTFGATSTLRVDVAANGDADILNVRDTLTIEEGAKLDLVFLDGKPTIGQRFEVASADEIVGTFADTYSTAFLGLRDQGVAGSVTLAYEQLRGLDAAAETDNQGAVASELSAMGGSNALLTGLLNAATDDAARTAFDQLSGDVHASVRTAMAEDSRLTRNAVLDRLSQSDDRNIWGQIFWNSGSSDGNRNAANTKRETWGFIAGADAAVTDNLLLGFAAAYQSKDVDQGARSTDAKVETISLLGYVGAQAGALRVKAGAGYAWGDVETSRSVRFGDFSDRLTADYNANLFQAFAEAGVRLPLGGGFVEPVAQIAYLAAKTDGFSETGGLAALTAEKATEKSTISTLGARFSTAQIGALNFTGLVGWQHSFGSLDPQTSFRFAGSDRFDITGAAQSRNAAVANIAAQIKLSESANLSVGYDGVLGNAGQDHAAKVGFRFAF